MEKFQSAGIDFAFPSQTLYLANENKRQLKLEILEGAVPLDGANQETTQK